MVFDYFKVFSMRAIKAWKSISDCLNLQVRKIEADSLFQTVKSILHIHGSQIDYCIAKKDASKMINFGKKPLSIPNMASEKCKQSKEWTILTPNSVWCLLQIQWRASISKFFSLMQKQLHIVEVGSSTLLGSQSMHL